MADNTTLNPGAAGDVIRTVEKTGKKTQVVTLDLGGSGAESLTSGSVPVTAASLPLPTGAATEATLAGVLSALGTTLDVTLDGVTVTTGPIYSTGTNPSDPGLVVNSRVAQFWSPDHFGNDPAATNKYYAQQMNDYGDLLVALSTIQLSAGVVPMSCGAGAVEAGSFRVTLATDDTLAGLKKAEDSAHVSGDSGIMALSVRRDATGALAADGDYAPIQTDSNGNLKVAILGSAGTDIAAIAASASVLDDWDESDRAKVNLIAAQAGVDGGSGASSAKTIRVIHATDDPNVAMWKADDSAFTVATTQVAPVGFLADETATDSVDEGDIGAARMTLDRKVQVCAEIESNSMRTGGTAATPKFAKIAASGSGNNTIVPAVNPKKIRVLALSLSANGTVNAKFQDGAGGTDLTGLTYMVVNSGIVLPFNPVGWFETSSNTLLNLNLSAAIAVGGSLTYIEV